MINGYFFILGKPVTNAHVPLLYFTSGSPAGFFLLLILLDRTGKDNMSVAVVFSL